MYIKLYETLIEIDLICAMGWPRPTRNNRPYGKKNQQNIIKRVDGCGAGAERALAIQPSHGKLY